GAAAQRVYFDSLSPKYLSIYQTLVSPSGLPFPSSNASYNSGPVTLAESGSYTLLFSGSGDTTGSISFQWLDAGVQPALPINSDLTGTLPANRSILYQLPGTNGEHLYFNSKAVNGGGAIWTLYGPNNAYVGNAGLSGDFEV